MRGHHPAPVSSPIADYLHQLHERFLRVKDGSVATYIPELAKADPDGFGICLVTAKTCDWIDEITSEFPRAATAVPSPRGEG